MIFGDRRERLLAEAVPRYVRLYDEGGVAAERYTADLTGLLSLKKPGEYLYVRMDDNPLGSGGYTLSRGHPPYTELGRAASFGDLPEGCKNLVLDMYQKMWNL
jgi:hypothetical protein